MTIEVDIDRLVEDHGTVVVFAGVADSGDRTGVAVDHRCAQPIADALDAGEIPTVVCEAWQIVAESD